MTPKTYLPRPLRSSSQNNRYLNEIQHQLRRATPTRGRGIRIRQRRSGTIIEAAPGGGGGVSGVVFRGEYNSGRLYVRGDMVKISAGLASGVYLATANMTVITQNPWLGNPWTQISKLLDQWL